MLGELTKELLINALTVTDSGYLEEELSSLEATQEEAEELSEIVRAELEGRGEEAPEEPEDPPAEPAV